MPNRMDDRNRRVLREYQRGRCIEDVGADFGLSRERVRQIVKREVRLQREQRVSENAWRRFDIAAAERSTGRSFDPIHRLLVNWQIALDAIADFS